MTKTVLKYILLFTILLSSTYCFSADSTKYKHVATVYADSKGGAIKYPEGIAYGDKSLVIVADTGNNRLLRYTLEEERLMGGTEIKVPQLSVPHQVQLNSKGDIFVIDGKKRRIIHLKPDGTFADYLDPQGLPAPTSIVPKSLKIDATDTMYLLDIFAERVVVTDPAGKFLKQLPFPDNTGFIADLAIDEKGTVYILDSVNNSVYSAAKEATIFTLLTKDLQEHAESCTAIAVDKRGLIYVVDKDGGAVVLIGQDGTFRQRLFGLGVKNGLLSYPTQICITDTGYLLIADKGNSRVQLFELVK